MSVMGFKLVSNKHVHTHTVEERKYKLMILIIKTATGLTEGELKTKRRRPGELTQSLLTRGLRPRTVSKPSRSLQGGCGPLVPQYATSTGTQPVCSEWKHSEEPAQRHRYRLEGRRKQET